MVSKKRFSFLVALLFLILPFFVSAYTGSIVRGEVVDQDNNLVSGAILKFDCLDVSKVKYPERTDTFGTFRVEDFPIGDCEIFAQANEFIGSGIVHVEKDKGSKIIIKLDQKIVKSDSRFILFVFIFLFLLCVIAYATYYLLSSFTHQKKSEVEKNRMIQKSEQRDELFSQENKFNQGSKQNAEAIVLTPSKIDSKRLKTVFVALSKTEQQVVTYLQDQSGEVVQAAIRHALHLPRTTLGRALQSLEQKKVVITKKEGKAVKVKFTSWILEKE